MEVATVVLIDLAPQIIDPLPIVITLHRDHSMVFKRFLLSRMELVKVILAKVDLVLHTVPLGMLNTTAYRVHTVVQLLLECFRQGLGSC